MTVSRGGSHHLSVRSVLAAICARPADASVVDDTSEKSSSASASTRCAHETHLGVTFGCDGAYDGHHRSARSGAGTTPRRDPTQVIRRPSQYRTGLTSGGYASGPAAEGRNRACTGRMTFTSSPVPPPVHGGGQVVMVELGNHVQRDLFRADLGARPAVGTATETRLVVRCHHLHHPLVALRLTLRELAKVSDLGAQEERGRSVRAGGHAGAAADAVGRLPERI